MIGHQATWSSLPHLDAPVQVVVAVVGGQPVVAAVDAEAAPGDAVGNSQATPAVESIDRKGPSVE